MRTLLLTTLVVCIAALAGCSSDPRMIVAEVGPGYSELRGVSEVHVVSVKLPNKIEGQGGGEFNDRWQREWPTQGSRYVATGISSVTMNRINAVADVQKPKQGIYVEVVVRSMDVGQRLDRPPVHTVGGREGWSRVIADAYIYNATTGHLCARLDIDQSSGAGDVLEADMTEIGRQIGLWLERER